MENLELDSCVAGLTPKLIYDSRNALFTPTRGTYGEVNCGVFREVLGGNYAAIYINLAAPGSDPDFSPVPMVHEGFRLHR